MRNSEQLARSLLHDVGLYCCGRHPLMHLLTCLRPPTAPMARSTIQNNPELNTIPDLSALTGVQTL